MFSFAMRAASGYAAISCTVTTEKVFEMFKDDASDPMSYFRDISTFGGCTAGPVAALENPQWCEKVIAEHGDRIAVGLDVRGIIDSGLPQALTPPVYARAGDWMLALVLAAFSMMAAISAKLRR
mgnify:CR=1 FL=1